jgi:hypothetical protein
MDITAFIVQCGPSPVPEVLCTLKTPHTTGYRTRPDRVFAVHELIIKSEVVVVEAEGEPPVGPE